MVSTFRRRSTTQPPRSTGWPDRPDDPRPEAGRSRPAQRRHHRRAPGRRWGLPGLADVPGLPLLLAPRRRLHRRRDESRWAAWRAPRRSSHWCARVITDRADRITALVERSKRGESVPSGDHLPTRFTFDGAEVGEEWWDFQLDGYGDVDVGARRPHPSTRRAATGNTAGRRVVRCLSHRLLEGTVLRLVGGARRWRSPVDAGGDRRRSGMRLLHWASVPTSPARRPRRPTRSTRSSSDAASSTVTSSRPSTAELRSTPASSRVPCRWARRPRRRRRRGDVPGGRRPARPRRRPPLPRRHLLRRRPLGVARRLARLVRGRDRTRRRSAAAAGVDARAGRRRRSAPRAGHRARHSILHSSPEWERAGARSPDRCCGRMRCTSPSPTRSGCSMDAENAAGPSIVRSERGIRTASTPTSATPSCPWSAKPLELRVLATVGVDAVWVGRSRPASHCRSSPSTPTSCTRQPSNAEGHLAAASGARPDLGGPAHLARRHRPCRGRRRRPAALSLPLALALGQRHDRVVRSLAGTLVTHWRRVGRQ